MLLDCPKFNRASLALGESTDLQSSNLKMSVTCTAADLHKYSVNIDSPAAGLKLYASFALKQYPSNVWSIPLSNDLKTQFAAMKQPVSLSGIYTLDGQMHQCTTKCLMMIDNGRGHFNYGVAYFWVLLMTELADGRQVFINLSDGLGSEFNSVDKASEDFIIVGDIHYKLDVTRLDYYKDDYLSKKRVYTMPETESKQYKGRSCDLEFTAVEKFEDGVNAAVVAMKQYLIYGYFTGHCTIDGEKLDIVKAYGHVEHVFSRW